MEFFSHPNNLATLKFEQYFSVSVKKKQEKWGNISVDRQERKRISFQPVFSNLH